MLNRQHEAKAPPFEFVVFEDKTGVPVECDGIAGIAWVDAASGGGADEKPAEVVKEDGGELTSNTNIEDRDTIEQSMLDMLAMAFVGDAVSKGKAVEITPEIAEEEGAEQFEALGSNPAGRDGARGTHSHKWDASKLFALACCADKHKQGKEEATKKMGLPKAERRSSPVAFSTLAAGSASEPDDSLLPGVDLHVASPILFGPAMCQSPQTAGEAPASDEATLLRPIPLPRRLPVPRPLPLPGQLRRPRPCPLFLFAPEEAARVAALEPPAVVAVAVPADPGQSPRRTNSGTEPVLLVIVN